MEERPVVRLGEPFEVFYRREYRPVLGLAIVLSGNRAAAEELVQDAFLVTLRDWERVSQMEYPGAWVRRVVANGSASRFRRAAAHTRALLRIRPCILPLHAQPEQRRPVAYFAQRDRPNRADVDSQIAHRGQWGWRGGVVVSSLACGVSLL